MPRQESTLQEGEAPFSLAPAIFTPFTGLPSGPRAPLDQTEKLQRIISNLDAHHQAVRENMLFLLQTRAQSLIAKAQASLDALHGTNSDSISSSSACGIPTNAEHESLNADLRSLLQRLRAPSKNGEKSAMYHLSPDTPPLQELLVASPQPSTLNDHYNAQKRDNPPSPAALTASTIKAALNNELRELVDRGVRELQNYDEHAAKTTLFYRQALERRTMRDEPCNPLQS